jgi:hypothetical protein
MSPTAKSLALLRELGYLAVVTEHWDGFAKVRRDLLGCIDVLGLKHEPQPQVEQGPRPAGVAGLAEGRLQIRNLELGRPRVRREALAGEDLAAELIVVPPRTRRPKRGERQGELFS